MIQKNERLIEINMELETLERREFMINMADFLSSNDKRQLEEIHARVSELTEEKNRIENS